MKTKLKILMICKSLPWRFKGGIQTHTWQLSQAIQAEGHEVSILTAGGFSRPESNEMKQGIKVIEVPYFPGRYLKPLSILAEELSFNLAVKQWVKENHHTYDIVHAQGRSGYLLYTLGTINHKLVNTVHGLISKESRNQRFWNLNALIHRLTASFFESKTIRSAAQCLSVSRDLKKDIGEKNTKIEAEVVPNGVNFDPNEPLMIGRKPARFLFVGRLHPVKGILPLVNAMATGKETFELDIIGSGPQESALRKVIQRKGLGQRVRLLGEYTNDAIQECIPHYQALVLPSSYETQGIVLLEANAHAVPVIASDLASIRETVTHKENGLLCPAGKPQQFIAAMQHMIDNPIETQLMGIRGRQKVVAQYGWQQIAASTINTYQKLAC